MMTRTALTFSLICCGAWLLIAPLQLLAQQPNKKQDAEVIQYRKIFVPQDKEEKWDQEEFGLGLWISLSEFESMISKLRSKKTSLPKTKTIQHAIYRARLDQAKLSGTVDFRLSSEIQSTSLRVITDTNLNFWTDLSQENAAISFATVMQNRDSQIGFLQSESPEQTITAQWNVPLKKLDNGNYRGKLVFPEADSQLFFLEKDIRFSLRLLEGILVPQTEIKDEMKQVLKDQDPIDLENTWILAPSGNQTLEFELIQNDRPQQNPSLFLSHEDQFQITPSQVKLSSQIDCWGDITKHETLELLVNNTFVIRSLTINGQPADYQIKSTQQSSQNKIELPLAKYKNRAALLIEISGVAPTKWQRNLQLTLPRIIFPERSWEEGAAFIELPPGDSFHRFLNEQISLRTFRQSEATAQMTIIADYLDAQTKPSLSFSNAADKAKYQLGTTLSFRETKVEAQVACRLENPIGSTFAFDFRLQNDWQIENVSLEQKQLDFKWNIIKKKNVNYLQVRFKKPISSVYNPKLLIQLSRSNNNFGQTQSLNNLIPLILPQENLSETWCSLNSVTPLSIITNIEAYSMLQDIDQLPASATSLLTLNDQSRLINLNDKEQTDFEFRVSRKNNSQAKITSFVSQFEAAWSQNITIEFRELDASIESLDIRMNRDWPAASPWQLNQQALVYPRRLNEQELITAGYLSDMIIYRLEIPLGIEFPLTLTSSLPLGSLTESDPLILEVLNASSQEYELKILQPASYQISTNRARVTELYQFENNSEQNAHRSRLRRFVFHPNEIFQSLDSQKFLQVRAVAESSLPQAYVEACQHFLQIHDRSGLEIETRFKLIRNKPESTFELELPVASQLLLAECNKKPINFKIQGKKVRLELPRELSTCDLRLVYQQMVPATWFSFKLQPHFLKFDQMVGSVSYELHHLPQHYCSTYPAEASFLQHLQVMLGGDRLANLPRDETQTSKRIIEAMEQQKSLRLWNASSLNALGFGLLFCCCLLPVSLQMLGIRIYFALSLAIIAVSSLLPMVFYPLTSNLFQGLVLGLFIRIFWNERWNLSFRADVSQNGTSKVVQNSNLIILISFCLLSCQSGFAQENQPAQDREKIYSILVPIDQAKKPTGEVYLPSNFHKLLLESLAKTESKLPDWYLVSADYVVKHNSAIDDSFTDSIELTIKYQIRTSQDQQLLKINLPEPFQEITQVKLDQAFIPIQWVNERKSLDVLVAKAGIHELEIKVLPISPTSATSNRWQLSLTPSFDTQLTVAGDYEKNQFQLITETIDFSLQADKTLSIGPAKMITLEAIKKEADSRHQYDQINLIRVENQIATIDCKLDVFNVQQPLDSLTFEVDPRLELVTSLTDYGRLSQEKSVEGKQRFRLNLSEPLSNRKLFDLQFRYRRASDFGKIQFPEIRILSGSLRQQMIGIAVNPRYQVTTVSHAASKIVSLNNFNMLWQSVTENLREAISFDAPGSQTLEIMLHPVPTEATAELQTEVKIGYEKIKRNDQLTLSIERGELHCFELKLPLGVKIEDVRSTELKESAFSWSYQEKTQKLAIQLAEQITETHKFEILSTINPDWKFPYQFQPLLIDSIPLEKSTVSFSRAHDVEIISISENGYQSIEESAANENSSSIIETFAVESPEEQKSLPKIVFEAQQNVVSLSGEIRTTFGRLNNRWTARVDCELLQRGGQLDYFEFYVPEELNLDPSSLSGFVAGSSSIPNESGKIWRLTPKGSLSQTLRFNFLAQLDESYEFQPKFSGIRLLGQPQLTRIVAIPKRIGNEQAAWNTDTLQRLVVSSRWLKARGFSPNFDIYQAILPFQCQLLERSAASVTPEIALQVNQVQFDTQLRSYQVVDFYLQAEGAPTINILLPEKMTLTGCYLNGNLVTPIAINQNRITLPLIANDLLQKLTIKGQSSLSPDPVSALDLIHSDQQAANAFCFVQAPTGYQLAEQQRISSDSFYETLINRLIQRIDQASLQATELNELELAQWQDSQTKDLIHWFKKWQDETKFDPNIWDKTITQLVQLNELSISPDDLSSSTLKLPKDPNQIHITSRQVRFYLQTNEESRSISLHQPKQVATFPFAYLALLVGLSAIYLGFLYIFNDQQRKQLVIQWLARSANLIGLSLGVLWWLFLVPSFVGFLLIAIFVLSSIAPWDFAKFRLVKVRNH